MWLAEGLQGVTRMAYSPRLWLMAIGWLNKINKGYKGYKDGLQPESLADGKLAGETKSTSVEN